MHVPGSLGERLESSGIEGIYSCPEAEPASRKELPPLNQLVEEEWPELPYTMMGVTAAARPQNGKRFYWRDHSVQCGDIELNLICRCSEEGTFTCTAIYSRRDYSRQNSRRDFLVPLRPSLKEHQLRWSAPGICERANLTGAELVEVLLAELVTLSAKGFSQENASHTSTDLDDARGAGGEAIELE